MSPRSRSGRWPRCSSSARLSYSKPPRLQRVRRQQQETVLMVERLAPPRVPAIPAAQRRFGHRGVQLVSVVGAHHLADVGRRRGRPRQGPRIDHGDPPSTGGQLPCGGEPEHAGADDDDRTGDTHDRSRIIGQPAEDIGGTPGSRPRPCDVRRRSLSAMQKRKPQPASAIRRCPIDRVVEVLTHLVVRKRSL